ncbi:MAG: peptide-methionine (S)-S-oxide reductase MsrA [Candidatus Omnitrophica bacterium]|nr:peptide-methionine (S)-S-oxide reductase MsrA [Candidatus Omnitrophota bacterium]
MSEKKEKSPQTAVFGAGCFWGVEETFRRLGGVLSTEAGYAGGAIENPSYEQVCSGHTGHAEAVRIVFDAERINYPELLSVFWRSHDPTTLNRQGPDVGDQYRSVIFFMTPEQEVLAKKSREIVERSGAWPRPIVTEITRFSNFFRAEEYHQQYLAKRGLGPCH